MSLENYEGTAIDTDVLYDVEPIEESVQDTDVDASVESEETPAESSTEETPTTLYVEGIGELTAEEIKKTIGSAYPREEEVTMDIRGRNLVSGLPETREITSTEMLSALKDSVVKIADAVHSVLEKTPPELSADISDKGILMTGGGSLLWGLDKLIQKRTGIDAYVAEDAISSVARGTGEALNSIKLMSKSSYKKKY